MSERVSQAATVAACTKLSELAPCAAELQAHVREIVESPAFKGSPRSQQFLQHVTDAAIAGHTDHLKERSLGVDLFGRPASYDTGEDAIVRVTASDVRKRLHHFYAEIGFNSEIRVDLPSGSYLPEFRRVPASSLAASPTAAPRALVAEERRDTEAPARRTVTWLVLLALGLALICCSLWFWHRRSSANGPTVGNLLPWSALLQPGRQVQLVLSDPDMSTVQELLGFQVTLSDYANRRYVPDSLPLKAEMRTILRSFRGVDVASVDVGITLQISDLARSGPESRQVNTHNARSLQLNHFKTEDNFILLGSPRSNPWGALFEDQLDFKFAYDEDRKQEIIRNNRPQQGELPLYVPTAKGWDTGQAFAILAFVGNPNQTGQVLLLAGTNAEGTEAAGKVATNVDLLSGTLQRCGIDPSGGVRHFEALLRVRTMAGSPNTLEVIACHRLPNSPSP